MLRVHPHLERAIPDIIRPQVKLVLIGGATLQESNSAAVRRYFYRSRCWTGERRVSKDPLDRKFTGLSGQRDQQQQTADAAHLENSARGTMNA